MKWINAIVFKSSCTNTTEKKTRMITFIKEKIKKSDGQTNMDVYRVAAHVILQIIISEQKFHLFC